MAIKIILDILFCHTFGGWGWSKTKLWDISFLCTLPYNTNINLDGWDIKAKIGTKSQQQEGNS